MILRKQKGCYGLYYNDNFNKLKPYAHVKTRLLDSSDIIEQLGLIDIYGKSRIIPAFEHKNIEYMTYYGIFRNRLNFGEITYGLNNYGIYKPWFNHFKNIMHIDKKDIKPIFKIVKMLERPYYLGYINRISKMFIYSKFFSDIGIGIYILPTLYDYVYDEIDIINLQYDKDVLAKDIMAMYDTVKLKVLHKFRFVLYLKDLNDNSIDIYTFIHNGKKLEIYELIVNEIKIFMNKVAGIELDENLINIFFNIDLKYDTMQVIFYFFNNSKDVLYQSIYETSHFISNIMMKNIIKHNQDLYVSLQLSPEKMEENDPLDPLFLLYKHNNSLKSSSGGRTYKLIKDELYGGYLGKLSRLLQTDNMVVLSKYHMIVDLQIICSDIILLQDKYGNYYEIIIKNTSVDVIDRYLKRRSLDSNKERYLNPIKKLLDNADKIKLSVFKGDCFVEIIIRKISNKIPLSYGFMLPLQIKSIPYIESNAKYKENYKKKCIQKYENVIDIFIILFAIYITAIRDDIIEVIGLFKTYFTKIQLMNDQLLNITHIISQHFYIRPKFYLDSSANLDNYILWYLPEVLPINYIKLDELFKYMTIDETKYDNFYNEYKKDMNVRTLLLECINYKYKDFIYNFRELSTDNKVEIDNLLNFFLRHNYLSQLYGSSIFILKNNLIYESHNQNESLDGYKIINIKKYDKIPYQEILKNKFFIHANYPNAPDYSIFHLQISHNYDSIKTIMNKFKSVNSTQLFIQLMLLSNNQINTTNTRVLPWNYLSKYYIDYYKLLILYKNDKEYFLNFCPELMNDIFG